MYAGQPLGQRATHLGRVCCPGDVAHQALVAGTVLAGDHHRLLHPVQPGQRRLHLTQLDAIPADLDLLIGTAQIPQLPISTPTHQIPGAIHPRPRPPERTRHKPRPGQPARRQYPHPTPAPATYNSPTTPTGTGRNHPSSTNNAAPGTGEPIGTAPDPAVNGALIGRIHRRLGRAVDVDHHPPRRPPIHHLGRAGAHRAITNAADSKPSGDSTATADGVWVNTLTCSQPATRGSPPVSRATDSGTTTSRPPCSSAPQISHTEKSKP